MILSHFCPVAVSNDWLAGWLTGLYCVHVVTTGVRLCSLRA